jgi:hypothetical protein
MRLAAIRCAAVGGAYLQRLGIEGLSAIARLGPLRDLMMSAALYARSLPAVTVGTELIGVLDLDSSAIAPGQGHRSGFAKKLNGRHMNGRQLPGQRQSRIRCATDCFHT